MKEKIRDLVKEGLLNSSYDEVDFQIEYPSDSTHGDYSTNVALILSKKVSKPPLEVAEEIVDEISKVLPSEVKEVQVAGPGFINFYLSETFLFKVVDNIVNTDNYGYNDHLKDKKVLIEYTDPNPFKEFHIGHLMSNTIGEVISRLAEANGALVKRACWQGDTGLHIAKTIWGLKEIGEPDDSMTLKEKVQILGKAYSHGSNNYEENKLEIDEINKKIFDKSDEEINRMYKEGRKWSLEYFETIYEKLDTKFDYYFFESEEGETGKKIVEENIENGIFERSDNAVIYKGEKNGLHTRVFINSLGLPTYEAKELGLALAKYEKFKYDTSIVISGNEIDAYFKVLFSAMQEVMPEIRLKTKHLSHGMLRFKDGKMSSRKGTVITAENLINDVSLLVKEKLEGDNIEEDALRISIGAIKYSILKQSIGKDIIFDFDKSISFEGDSGPYLQYTYTRAKSILEKAKKENILRKTVALDWESTEVEKLLVRFPEIVKYSYENHAPQLLVSYTTELSSAFNSLYGSTQIVDTEDENSPYKIAITVALMKVLENSLKIIGIKVPSRM